MVKEDVTKTALGVHRYVRDRNRIQEPARPGNAVEINILLEQLAALIEPVAIHFQWRPQYATRSMRWSWKQAIDGRADAIVTHNVADFSGVGKLFRELKLPLSIKKAAQRLAKEDGVSLNSGSPLR